jgi:hypothetical protein
VTTPDSWTAPRFPAAQPAAAALPTFGALARIRSDLVLGSGPLGYSRSAPRMLLHTSQSPQAYAELAATGTLTGPTAAQVSEWEDFEGWEGEDGFTGSYDWLVRHMNAAVAPADRVPPGRYPLWAWANIRRYDLAYHIRDCAPTAEAPDGRVWLTLSLPRSRVFCTDYDGWHSVLNRTPGFPALPRTGLTDRKVNRLFDAAERAVTGALPIPGQRVGDWTPEYRAALEESWKHCFTFGRRDYVQATFAQLHAAEVVSAVRPVAVPPRARGERRRRGRSWSALDRPGSPAEEPARPGSSA